MKCPKCSKENPEDNKFCRQCGTGLILTCSNCGNELQINDKFCGKCGQDLSEPTKATAIDYSEPQSYAEILSRKNPHQPEFHRGRA